MRKATDPVAPLCRHAALMALFSMGCESAPLPTPLQNDIGTLEAGVPALEIGVNDELQKPVDAALLLNGNVVVADAFAKAILIFDSAGNLQKAVGRAGAGPGEFQVPGWVDECEPNTAFVFDAALSRVTVLDSAGNVVRLFTIERLPILACGAGVLAGLGATAPQSRPAPGAVPKDVEADLQVLDSIGKERARVEGLTLGNPRPLGKESSIAILQNRIWVGTADSAYVQSYTLKGKRGRGLALGLPTRKVGDRHWEAIIDERVSMAADRETRESGRAILREIPRPQLLPPYRSVFANAGTLWVATSFPGDSSTVIYGYTSEGHPLRPIRFAPALRILDVTNTAVIGSTEIDGQPRIHVYRFEKGILTP